MGVALGPVPQHSGGGGTSKETCVVVQQVKLLPAVLAPPHQSVRSSLRVSSSEPAPADVPEKAVDEGLSA